MPGLEPVITPFFYLPLDPSAILTFQEKPICVVFSVFILGRGLANNENELYVQYEGDKQYSMSLSEKYLPSKSESVKCAIFHYSKLCKLDSLKTGGPPGFY